MCSLLSCRWYLPLCIFVPFKKVNDYFCPFLFNTLIWYCWIRWNGWWYQLVLDWCSFLTRALLKGIFFLMHLMFIYVCFLLYLHRVWFCGFYLRKGFHIYIVLHIFIPSLVHFQGHTSWESVQKNMWMSYFPCFVYRLHTCIYRKSFEVYIHI